MVNQWVILELSSKADGEDPDLVKKSITCSLKGAEIFIPAAITQVGADRVVHYLVEGYAFIRHTFEQKAYMRLENTRYVQSVLTTISRAAGGRPTKNLSFVTDADIEKMRRQIHRETDQGIGVNDTVLITSGAYKQITAKVIEEIPEEDKVQVHIQLLSKDSIITLPRSFLRLVEKAKRPECVVKYEELRNWFNDTVDIIRLEPLQLNMVELKALHSKYLSLTAWSARKEPIENTIVALQRNLNLKGIKQAWANLERLQAWHRRYQSLVELPKRFPKTTKIQKKFEELQELRKFQRRVDKLAREVRALERSLK